MPDYFLWHVTSCSLILIYWLLEENTPHILRFFERIQRKFFSLQGCLFVCYVTLTAVSGARGGAVDWGTLLQADFRWCHWNFSLTTLTYWNPQDISRPVMGLLYIYFRIDLSVTHTSCISFTLFDCDSVDVIPVWHWLLVSESPSNQNCDHDCDFDYDYFRHCDWMGLWRSA